MTGMTTDETYKSQGVRINSTKYTLLRDLGKQTFPVKVRRARLLRAKRMRRGARARAARLTRSPPRRPRSSRTGARPT